MKKISIELDVRFLYLSTLFVVLSVVFGFIPKEKAPPENEVGRFQVVSSERGFVLLDTKTGQYILDSQVGYGKEMKWIKGDFATSFKNGIDKTAR